MPESPVSRPVRTPLREMDTFGLHEIPVSACPLSDLGYGARGSGSAIPPHSTLIFTVGLALRLAACMLSKRGSALHCRALPPAAANWQLCAGRVDRLRAQ